MNGADGVAGWGCQPVIDPATRRATLRSWEGFAVLLLRELLGLTQEELRLKAGIGLRTLCEFERGRGNLTEELREWLATALGLQVSELSFLAEQLRRRWLGPAPWTLSHRQRREQHAARVASRRRETLETAARRARTKAR